MNEFRTSKYYHPGRTLSEKLEEQMLSPEDFGKLHDIDPEIIWDIILDCRIIDKSLAEKLEKATGLPVSFWLECHKNGI